MAADDGAAVWLNSAAQALGSHTLPWFMAGMLLVLTGTGAVWQLLPLARRRMPPVSGQAPGLFLLILVSSGFAIVAIAASVFAEMAEALQADEAMGHFDDALALALQRSASPGLLRAAATLTHLGDPLTITALGVLVAAVLLWQRRHWLALGWAVALAGNGVLTRVLKSVFERVRPVHEHGITVADGWSFPSGHTSAALVAYGMLAYLLLRNLPREQAAWRLPLLLAAVALAYTVGCSRVVLQVHYASDVIAGFASGAAWLAVCGFSIEALRWYHRQGDGRSPGIDVAA